MPRFVTLCRANCRDQSGSKSSGCLRFQKCLCLLYTQTVMHSFHVRPVLSHTLSPQRHEITSKCCRAPRARTSRQSPVCKRKKERKKKKECDLLEAFTSDIATAVFIFTQNVWGQLSFEVRSQSVWAGQSNYRAARSAGAGGVRGERLFEPQIITCLSLTSLHRLALHTGSVFVASLGIVLKSMFWVRTWADV